MGVACCGPQAACPGQRVAAIRRATESGGIGVASVSLWELAASVRPRPDTCFRDDREQRTFDRRGDGAVIHEITPEIAALATAFPADFSQDPADRLIGATARSLGLPLVTQ